MASADQLVVLVTGGNTGLGLETVKALAKSGKPYHLIIGARSLPKAEAALQTVQPGPGVSLSVAQVDVESDASIAAVAKMLTDNFGRLDVLLNNAGAQFDPDINEGKMSEREAWNKTWDVNVTGTHLLTKALAPLLLAAPAARVVFITSGLASIANAQGPQAAWPPNAPLPAGWPKANPGFPAYRSAKTGMNMLMAHWHRTLQNDGVKVFAVSPGMLATNLGGRPDAIKAAGAIDPAVGADRVRSVVEGEVDAHVGRAVHGKDVQPW